MKGIKQFNLRDMKWHSFIKYTGMLCISVIIGMLLLILVYMLPVENMKANIVRSSEIFKYEGLYPQLVIGYKYTTLDNFTDSIMLGAAIYDGPEETINKAVNNYHPDSVELSPEYALINYANEVSAYDYSAASYGRYWHGYLVPLKLLLLFFDYSDIRILNFFLQNFLLFIVIKQLCRIHMEQYVPAFLVTIFVLNPMTAALSLQFSSVYYITLLSALCLLRLAQKEATEQKIAGLFLMTGILTAYLDFLTYPLVPFGILLVLYLIINGDTIKIAGIRTLFQKALLWGVGYGGMWSGKWLVGSILMKGNFFADAFNQAMFRTSPGSLPGKEYSRLDAVVRCVSVFLKWPFLIVFLIGGGYLAFGIRKLTRRMVFQNTAIILLLIAIAFLPVGWILVMANHSYTHFGFVYKEFAISSFALLSLGIYLKDLVCNKKA